MSSVETGSRQERWKSIIPRETYPLFPHQVTCYKKTEEGGIEVLDEGECSGKKPELEEPCSNENSCEAADWIVSGACLGKQWIFSNLSSVFPLIPLCLQTRAAVRVFVVSPTARCTQSVLMAPDSRSRKKASDRWTFNFETQLQVQLLDAKRSGGRGGGGPVRSGGGQEAAH